MSVFAPSQRIQLLPGTKRGPDTVWADYNEINVNDTTEERRAKLEQWIAMRIGKVLMEHYNQREWKVMVDIDNQMLIIGCDSIPLAFPMNSVRICAATWSNRCKAFAHVLESGSRLRDSRPFLS